MASSFPPICDYRSATDFLFGRINYERTRRVPYRSRRFKLDRMRDLAERIGHPERSFPAVHIAGTKGKGSTALMIARILSAAGYRTGLYTSPHLHRLEERFVVDGQPCDEQELVALLARLEPVVREMDRCRDAQGDSQAPTYFEITTAAAMLYFQMRKVDIAVLEVGLGGRLDSTNICHPVVSAIISISFDHTRLLGKTLTAIAGEKAGIIRPAVPVITGVQVPEPYDVIERTAAENGSELLALGRDFDFDYHAPVVAAGETHCRCLEASSRLDYRETIRDQRRTMDQVPLRLLGRHQAVNAAVAIAACGALCRGGWRVEEAAIRTGLEQVQCPARIEIVARAPDVILDAAHNPASVAALLETIAERCPAGPRVLVFGTSADKDSRTMLTQLLPHFQHTVLTRYVHNPRGTDPERLLAIAGSLEPPPGAVHSMLHHRADPESAWRLVETLASPGHLICITGSFFLAAEIRRYAESPRPAAAPCC